MSVEVRNDVIQNLATYTSISANTAHFAPINANILFDGTEGWRILGALNPGSLGFDFTKDIYDVETGTPMTVKARHIIRYGGEVNMELFDYSDEIVNLLSGTTINPNYTYAVDGQTIVDDSVVTPTTTYFAVDDLTGLAVGDRVVISLGEADYGEFKETRKIQQIDTTNKILYLQGFLSIPPADGVDVKKVAMIHNVQGGNNLADYQLRALVSMDDGSFILIHIPKGNFVAPFAPNYQNSESAILLPLTFNAIGQGRTISGFSGQQVVIADHYSFFPVS